MKRTTSHLLLPRAGLRTIYFALLTIFYVGVAPASAVTIMQSETLSPTTASGWTNVTVGSISLAAGTEYVYSFTGNASVQDQGWGGFDYYGNSLRVGLFEGSTLLWSERMAGAGRAGVQPIAQSFDLGSLPASMQALNDALGNVDWNTATNVRVDAYTAGIGWPGWTITVNSGNFNLTTGPAPVPVPAASLLFLSGLGLMFGRSRRQCVRS